MTQEELLLKTLGWVDAMGGELMGEKQCGCEPLHYAIRMTYTQEANLGIAGATEQMGPVDIPIKFHDDRSFDGEQTVYLDGDSFAYLCTAKTSASMDLKVSGKISGFYPHEMMTVKLENTAPLEGKVKANCPEVHRTARLQAGGTAALGDTIEATVGKTLEFKPSSGLIMTKIELELVTTGK